MSDKLSMEPYKGMRDFYPEDFFILKHLFSAMRKEAESFGYEEYNGPTIEPTELYASKSSQEIISEQSYSFIDRGEREVTLRPEMTPTVARMVASRRRELGFPLRWFSIPTFFRYEQPQKGRLREHFQFNADIFGVENIEADVEIISLASEILKTLGAKEEDFVIRIGSRKIISALFEALSLSKEKERELSRLIDRRDKLPKEEYESGFMRIVGEDGKDLISLFEAKELEDFLSLTPPNFSAPEAILELENTLLGLKNSRIQNARFDPTLVRGFDYYSGIVFEIFDTNPNHRRAIAGGGRYDNLLSIFGEEKIPAVGFGMGDPMLQEFLKSRNLLPPFIPNTSLFLCQAPGASIDFVEKTAQAFRKTGVNTAIDFSGRKVGDQIRSAVKHRIPFLICLGEKEKESGKFLLKNLETEQEEELSFEEAVTRIRK